MPASHILACALAQPRRRDGCFWLSGCATLEKTDRALTAPWDHGLRCAHSRGRSTGNRRPSFNETSRAYRAFLSDPRRRQRLGTGFDSWHCDNYHPIASQCSVTVPGRHPTLRGLRFHGDIRDSFASIPVRSYPSRHNCRPRRPTAKSSGSCFRRTCAGS